MTIIESRPGPDQLDPDPASRFDLIICHGDRLVFHDHYGSPEQRLRMCVGLLVTSDLVAAAVDSAAAAMIARLHESRAPEWSTAPDAVLNEIAKLCRRWGVNVYASTTRKHSAAPAALFSVITDYPPLLPGEPS